MIQMNLIGCHSNKNGKFEKKNIKIVSPQKPYWGWGWYFEYIFLMIFIFHNYICPYSSMTVATLSFHGLILGKVEIGIYSCDAADILVQVFSEMFF